jgi:hypothetical protein
VWNSLTQPRGGMLGSKRISSALFIRSGGCRGGFFYDGLEAGNPSSAACPNGNSGAHSSASNGTPIQTQPCGRPGICISLRSQCYFLQG